MLISKLSCQFLLQFLFFVGQYLCPPEYSNYGWGLGWGWSGGGGGRSAGGHADHMSGTGLGSIHVVSLHSHHISANLLLLMLTE